MKVNLLIKVLICLGTLPWFRVARVIKPGVVLVPGCAPSSCAVLHSRYNIRNQFFTRRDFIDMQIATLAASLRERNRHVACRSRRYEPIDCGGTRFVDRHWIEYKLLFPCLEFHGGGERHQARLLV